MFLLDLLTDPPLSALSCRICGDLWDAMVGADEDVPRLQGWKGKGRGAVFSLFPFHSITQAIFPQSDKEISVLGLLKNAACWPT